MNSQFKGVVSSLYINGELVEKIKFNLTGPEGDKHNGFDRKLSGHDGEYIRTSQLCKGDTMFNWRTWTGLSFEEVKEIESLLDAEIPIGCFLENVIISGIPNFSQLLPTSRLVFPYKDYQQTILAVWEENGPCKTVGERFERHHKKSGLKTQLIKNSQGKRGVMGFVLAAGEISVGDSVLVYPPVR